MSETTMAPAQSRHVTQQDDNLVNFLRYARTRPVPLIGTFPTGAIGGGPTSMASFSTEIPSIPAWATAMVIEATLPIALVIPAGNHNVNVSPYFPFSAIQMQLKIGGAPPWDLMSLVPWWLDEITARRNYDTAYTGPGSANQQDPGPFAFATPNLTPGSVIAGGAGGGTTNGTVTFRCRVRLQRDPRRLFGAVPLGDPENRPQLTVQLSSLVGPNPENNAFQAPDGAAVTASLSAPGAVNVIFEAASLDVLPNGIGTIPTPVVGMGLVCNYTTKTQASSGQMIKVGHRAAMLYEKVMHALINGQVGQRADYFGNWLTEEQQSARWEYDAVAGTFAQYYADVQRRYGRYLPTGLYIDDLESGRNPDFPALTPYEAHQTPDVSYAAEFGLPATPAWTHALRIPAGTAMSGAYVATYEIGLVNVPY